MSETLHFKIRGMHCVSCASQIEKTLAALEGINEVYVNFVNEKATIKSQEFSSHLVQDILDSLKKQGYEGEHLNNALVTHNHSHSHGKESTYTLSFVDLWIAILFTAPLITTHMIGFYISPYIQLFCATVVQFWCARRFYIAAWFSLKNMMSNMDLLVILGTSAAYSYSIVSLFLGRHDFYFETGAMVTTLVLLGRFLQDRAKKSANADVRALIKLTPLTALVEREGVYKEVASEDIKKGDSVMVRAWQRIPADGIICQGASEIDESMITGESIPVFKEVGDKIIGGTINTFGRLYYKVTNVGHESTLFRMVRLVEEAQSSQPPIQKRVDQISAVFVPLILIISLITFGIWYIIGPSFDHALLTSVSVLVVACPCALGIATPTAIVVAMGTAARKGILIKNLESLEALRQVDEIVFDKTGTLTKGEFNLTVSMPLSTIPEDEVLCLAASLQRGSEHPLAKAFLKAFKNKKFIDVKNFTSLPGKGVQGTINDMVYYLGSEKLMDEHEISVPHSAKVGYTTVYLATEGRLLGLFRLVDTPRKKATQTLKRLKTMGLKTVMLTGDNKETAYSIGTKIGIDEVFAQLQPKDKLNYVKAQEQHHHRLAMVGDGINDGPALAAATVGFAMGSGTDIAIDAAPITLMHPSLDLIPQAFLLSTKTFHIIQENLFWAFLFNIIGVGFAVFGKLTPEIAGGAMAASSLIVVMNSLRLK